VSAEVNRYYMACLDLRGRRCVVVGGGRVALDKTLGLLEAGAAVTVVAPELLPDLGRLAVHRQPERYRTAHLDGAFLAIAATGERTVDEQVSRDAEQRGLLCNVADVPELCNFILPAIFRRDPITVAVSTGGASPALAKRLRDRIGELVEPRHAELALRLQALRPWAKTELAGYAERRSYFEQLLDAEL
jgi:precorrin-2 dehydrogenase / sirohydrochlorin ferrochelatase